MAKQIEVRQYKTEKDMQRDANRWIKRGYVIANQTHDRPSSGCGRFLLAGPFAFFWKPSPRWIVTYRKSIS